MSGKPPIRWILLWILATACGVSTVAAAPEEETPEPEVTTSPVSLAEIQSLDVLTTDVLQPASIIRLTSPTERVILHPITLDALVALTVERNLDYKISQVNLSVAGDEVTAQHGIFDLLLSGSVEQREATAQGSIFFTLQQGAGGIAGSRQQAATPRVFEEPAPEVRRQQDLGPGSDIDQLLRELRDLESALSEGFQSDFEDVTRSKTKSGNVQVTQLTPLGGTLGAGYSVSRNWQDPSFLNINPSYGQNASVWIVQPLPFFRNWGPDVTLSGIRIAKKNQETRESEARLSLLNQIAAVKQAYWDLANAIYNAEVQRLALKTAENLQTINELRLKYEVGTEIDVWEAKAGVARRRTTSIQAARAIKAAIDSLGRLTRVNEDNRQWNIWLIPHDLPPREEYRIDEEAFLAEAVLKRPDIEQAKLARERAEIRRKVARNQRMPRVDFFGSYGLSGLGPSVGRAGSNLRTQDFDSWAFGLDFSYPIPNRKARAEYRQAKKLVEGTNLIIKQVEDLAVFEVRSAIHDLRAARESIDTSRTQVRAEQEKLRGQIKRFEVGISTTQRLLERVDDLALAQSVLIAASASYNRAAVELDRARGILLEKHGIRIDDGSDFLPR